MLPWRGGAMIPNPPVSGFGLREDVRTLGAAAMQVGDENSTAFLVLAVIPAKAVHGRGTRPRCHARKIDAVPAGGFPPSRE